MKNYSLRLTHKANNEGMDINEITKDENPIDTESMGIKQIKQ